MRLKRNQRSDSEHIQSAQIVRSMLIVGAAQSVEIVISIVRIKLLAVLLGPAGIGILSLYQNLIELLVHSSGLGLPASGVREIASTGKNDVRRARVQRTLLIGLAIQGVFSILIIWLLRDLISVWVFGTTDRAVEVALGGVAVFLSMFLASNMAILQGRRRIADMSRVTIVGAFFGSFIGVLAVHQLGEPGLMWLIICSPISSLLVAFYLVRRLTPLPLASVGMRKFWKLWKQLAGLGLPLMLGALVQTIMLIVTRSEIAGTLGIDAAGHFSAAWGIATLYIGYLLHSMSVDYFPRLSEIIADPPAINKLINDQSQICLAIGGPFLILLIGCAPQVVKVLYSAKFHPAVEILQWLSVGNVLKLACWPIAFSIAAAAYGKTSLLLEVTFGGVFVTLIWLQLPGYGLSVIGPAFTISYAIYLLLALVLAYRIHGYRPEKLTLVLFASYMSLSIVFLILAPTRPDLVFWASWPVLGITGLIGVRIILEQIGPGGQVSYRIRSVFDAIGWPIKKK